jgi:hypothetical protein
LAKYVRNNTDWTNPSKIKPTDKEISDLNKGLRGKVPEINLPFTGTPEREVERCHIMQIIPEITTKEIMAQIRRMKKCTAAGTDEVLRKHVMHLGTQEILRVLFSLITACGIQPSMWRNHGTTLLLKEGKDPARAESYKPVTIGSLRSGIYRGIFDQKLRSKIGFTPRQKGFVIEQDASMMYTI